MYVGWESRWRIWEGEAANRARTHTCTFPHLHLDVEEVEDARAAVPGLVHGRAEGGDGGGLGRAEERADADLCVGKGGFEGRVCW